MAGVIAIAGIVVPAVVSFVAPLFVDSVKQKINERKESLADLHEVLDKGLKELLGLQSDKEREVSSNNEQKDLSELYKLWKMGASNIQGRVTFLNEEYKQVKVNKWRRCKRRCHVKKEIKRAPKEVTDLLGKCKEINVLVDKLPEQAIKEIGVTSIAEYPTLQNALEVLQFRLRINGVKCVALYGEKGVGKTTIIQHLNNHHFYDNSPDNKEFDMVIFIKVAADAQTDERTECLHILQKIAERIKVDTKANESEVAKRIQRELENKRYLLTLDAVRYAFTLNGIWGKLDISKHQKDSKVVISTHYPLASRSKCVDSIVKLMLSLQEAWDMFRNIVGDNDLYPIPNAQLVCDRFCCCLPLFIVPIAKSFKYREVPIDWKTRLDEWRHWPESGVAETDELFSILKICYERLRDPSKQKCFLYAALYPANSNIHTHYFVECRIVHGFLGNVNRATNYSGLRSRGINTIRTKAPC